MLVWACVCVAQQPSKLSSLVRPFVREAAPVIALEHVRVIGGTGAPAQDDQTIVIESGKIRAVGPADRTQVPEGARALDLRGATVLPGLVGMHDHLVYPAGFGGGLALYNEIGFSAPRLYLACGVTSLRTTGSLETYTDLGLKKWIDAGRIVGPKMHITGPYLEGAGAYTPQMHELSGPEDARQTMEFEREFVKAGGLLLAGEDPTG